MDGSPDSVTVTRAASNLPVGTELDLRLVPQNGAQIIVQSTPLAGTLASSTATATVTVPAGFSRFFVYTSWTP